MEEDFPISPSKRRRTESPVDATTNAPQPTIPGLDLSEPATSIETNSGAHEPMSEVAVNSEDESEEPQKSELENGPDLLNMLMMQVEAQSSDQTPNNQVEPVTEHVSKDIKDRQQVVTELVEPIHDDKRSLETQSGGAASTETTTGPLVETAQASTVEQDEKMTGLDSATIEENPVPETVMQDLPAPVQSETDPNEESIPQPDLTIAPAHHPENRFRTLEAQPEAIQPSSTDPPSTSDTAVPPEEREWESDSSPYTSSTDSSSDSDSDSEDGDNDYALLSPTEQARMLMDEVGSDDEGSKRTTSGAVVKTANEKFEEVIPKPDIVVTPEMKVEELGAVEAIVESTVLVKGKTTGEYQVLESGSLLCLQDRSVIGVVADTMGRVEQPLYTVRFTNDEAIAEAGVTDKGTAIYYVPQHSTFVFTQPLKGLKGSDASNFHDEEVGDEEMEFSDDEKEAEYKRITKLRRKGIDVDSMAPRGGRGGARGGRGGGRGRGRGGFQPGLPVHPENPMPSAGEAIALNYDDGEIGDYEPLRRPSTMESQPASVEQNNNQQPEQPHQEYQVPGFRLPDNRRDGNQRGRGFVQRGRGNRGRGSFPQNRIQQQNGYQHNGYQQQPQPQSQSQQPYSPIQQQSPQSWPPGIPPQGIPNFFNPNMMPNAPGFNFNFNQPGGALYAHQQNSYGQQQGYQQGYQQPNGYGQHQNTYSQQQPAYIQQHNAYNGQNQAYGAGAWGNNQAAAEQVQRELEALRRQQQQQGG